MAAPAPAEVSLEIKDDPAPEEEFQPRGGDQCPYNSAPWCSQLFFCFVDKILDRGEERTLQYEDLDELALRDQPTHVVSSLRRAWDQETATHESKPRIWRAIVRSDTVWGPLWVSGFWAFCESACAISQPVIVGRMVSWLSDKGSYLDGSLWVLALLSAAMFQVVAHHALYYYTMRGGFNVRTAVTGLIHEKMLLLSSASLSESSGGRVTNLVSNDVSKFDLFATNVHFGWSGLMDLAVVSVLLYFQVGTLPMLAGISVPVACLPLQVYLGKRFGFQRKVTAKLSDARINSASEVFTGIEMVKVQGWEVPLQARTADMRNRERQSIFISQSMKSVNLSLYFCTPALATLACFSVYWAQGSDFDTATIFSTLSLLHVLRLSIGKNFTRFVETLPEVMVSMERITTFLMFSEREAVENNPSQAALEPDKKHESQDKKHESQDHQGPGLALSEQSLQLKDATLGWSEQPMEGEFRLQNLNLTLKPGETLIVTGAVGSGKSAFLNALLGELYTLGGELKVSEHPMGFAAQQPWILAASIRENVLFGEQFEEERYWRTLEACGLMTDIQALQDGDQTEIGDKGVNLSGGQRARVALARVAYSRAQLCLLDDPLSAVDAHVGEHIFSQCIQGLMKDRTVVLTTHHVKHAPRCDYHLELGPGGEQASFGRPEGKFDEVQRTVAVSKVEEKDASKQLQLVQPEDRTVGEVSTETYSEYIRLGGRCRAISSVLLFALAQCCLVATDVWLSVWTDQEDTDAHWLFYVFVGLTAASLTAALVCNVVFFSATLKAASNLHHEAFWAILNAPLSFFTSNPHGRIMNKFSSDQGQVDEVLPVALFDTLQIGFIVLGSVCLVCVAVPWLLILIPPMVWGFVKLRNRFLISCRELKRMESITKSPLFSTFSQNLAGLLTIRAFGQQERLQDTFEGLLHRNGKAWHSWLLVNRWIGVRLDLLSFLVTLGCSVLVVALRDHIDTGLAALALVYCINLSGMFQYMVRQTAAVETMMTSVERILHYSKVPSEHTPSQELSEIPSSWPSAGTIQIEGLKVRYREDLPLVLRGLDVNIPGGTSVGIVGRTGSGKSTLAASLFRLNEVVAGRVLVDGVDLATVQLSDVRDRMAFIPQMPALFAGTLRFNLDPFNRYSDKDIWSALECVQLQGFVEAAPEKLELNVAEAGSNLSVGQRQLISMARSMLSRSRVVVMDECTANVDLETDQLVQHAIFHGDSFAGSSVVVIAHRIDTIINCDQVIVLDQGELVEFGDPTELQSRPEGAFAQMVAKSNVKPGATSA